MVDSITITLKRRDWIKFTTRINFRKTDGRHFCPFCRKMQAKNISWGSERCHTPSCAFQKVELALDKTKSGAGPKGPVPIGKKKLFKRELRDTEEEVLAAMADYPGYTWSRQEILDETGIMKNTCVEVLTRLVSDGYLTRPRRGFYDLREGIPWPKKRN